MRYTFSNDPLCGPACRSGQTGIAFSISNDPAFQNREFVFHGSSFLFDGYSHWFRGSTNPLHGSECFTVSAAVFPLTFSSHQDGIFTCYSAPEKKGLEILLEKGGYVHVHMGFERFDLDFSSCRTHVHAGMWNAITVVFRGDAGWCDLYINGVLSARKQFRRRTLLPFPEQPVYIGRRMDGHLTEALPFGCFYGFMDWVEITPGAPEEADILALHSSVYTGRQDEVLFALGMPRRSACQNDRQRPRYHLSPEGKWMNEPHGPMFYNGWYHIFYQGNPHAPTWDHLCWGHLRSRDMLHWESCPLALIPEKEANSQDGCWSGSSVIDREGKPRIYFTAGDDHRFPNQAVALAIPDDCTDEGLSKWSTLPSLVKEQDMGWMGEFRDPFVWLEQNTYYMLVGTGDDHNGGGNAILYSSPDGLDWKNHGFLLDYDFESNSEVGHVWELPVLLPLKDETSAVVCHILLLCAAQVENEIVETYYFLGSWDALACTFQKFHEKARLLDLGRGVFTGPSGMVTPDGRTVVFTIAQGRRSFMDEIHAGWAHNGGMPVELSIRDGQLQIQPIREANDLRSALLAETPEALEAVTGDMLNLEYTASDDQAAVTLHFGSHQKVISYDRCTKRLAVLDETGAEIGRWRTEEDNVDIGSEEIHFSCWLDHSLLEVYLNGRKAVSLRNYTDEARRFTVSGKCKALTLYEMRSAY